MDELTELGTAATTAQNTSPLDATAQFLTFEPGMYAVFFSAPQPVRSDVGVSLPCARLDALSPSLVLQGRAVISLMAEGGWLAHGDPPALIRVAGGRAGVLLTIYKAAGGMPAPELRIRFIRGDLEMEAPATPPQPVATLTTRRADLQDALPLQVLVHAQVRGDVEVGPAEWAGTPGSNLLLEGFSISTAGVPDLPAEALEYQAILGEGWNTPWFPAGEFCGSRGLALPLLGFRVRLTGASAARYRCTYWGSFVERGEIGPVNDGEGCEAAGQPMDALCIAVTPRDTPPDDDHGMTLDPQSALPAEDPAPLLPPALGLGRSGTPERKRRKLR